MELVTKEMVYHNLIPLGGSVWQRKFNLFYTQKPMLHYQNGLDEPNCRVLE